MTRTEEVGRRPYRRYNLRAMVTGLPELDDESVRRSPTAPGTARAQVGRIRHPRAPLVTTLAVMTVLTGAGIAWALGAPGYPYGHDPDAELLPTIIALPGGLIIAGVGGLGVTAHLLLLALPMFESVPRRRRSGSIGQTLGVAVGAVLVLVFPTGRVLQNFAYALGLQFSRLDWPVVFQALCILAGALCWWTIWRFHGWMVGACAACGSTTRFSWTDPAHAAQWGWRLAAISAIAALPYPLVRTGNIALILLGVSDTGGQELMPLLLIMALFVVLALGGAALTIGLFRPWGSVFPRRLPLIGGKPVPVAVAVVPASWVAVILTVTGTHTLLNLAVGRVGTSPLWQQIISGLSWTVWGSALGGATLGYYLKRRRRCDADRCSATA